MTLVLKGEKKIGYGVATFPNEILAKLDSPSYVKIQKKSKSRVFKAEVRDGAEGKQIFLEKGTFGLNAGAKVEIPRGNVTSETKCGYYFSEFTKTQRGNMVILGLFFLITGIGIKLALYIGENLFVWFYVTNEGKNNLKSLSDILSALGGVVTFISGLWMLNR